MRRITDRGFLMLNIAKSLLIVTVLNHFTATRQPQLVGSSLSTFGLVSLFLKLFIKLKL